MNFGVSGARCNGEEGEEGRRQKCEDENVQEGWIDERAVARGVQREHDKVTGEQGVLLNG